MSQLSPSVNVFEKDLSNYIPNTSTTNAAIAGRFTAGPLNVPVLVSNETQLLQIFGAPNNNNYMEWFCASQFLNYSSSLYVTRAAGAGLLNATQTGTGYLLDNANTFANLTTLEKASIGTFASKIPGVAGNSIGVIIVDYDGWDSFQNWATLTIGAANMPNGTTFDQYFSYAPTTTAYVANLAANGSTNAKNDEIHVLVYDATGAISGTVNTVLEVYAGLSKAVDAVDYSNQTIYAPNAINNKSNNIWMLSFPVAATTKTATITGAVLSGTTVTFTTSAPHNLDDGEIVTIASVVSASGSYNGTFTVVSVPTSNTFTVTNTSSPGAYTSGGTVTFTVSATELDANTGIFASQVSANGYSFAPFAFTGLANTYSLDYLMSGGTAGTLPTDAQILTAYGQYSNRETINVGHVITAGFDSTVIQYCVNTLAAGRQDAMAYMSVYNTTPGNPIMDTDTTPEQEAIACKSSWNLADQYSQYSMTDTGYKYIYDKYNNVYRWIPLNGDVAGICARLGTIAQEWFSPGGFTRGGLQNVIKLAFNPSQEQRDIIYPQGINPVVSFVDEGVVLFGDRTGTIKPSGFDRYNVRRLFIIIEKAIRKAAKYQLFEFNDVFTQNNFVNMVTPYLNTVKGLQGIADFKVICDSTNNTPQIVNSNQFVASIYVQPNKSINIINLTFINTPTGVSFSYYIGQ